MTENDAYEALIETITARVIERINRSRPAASKRWLSVKEAADHIGRTTNAVYMMIRAGKVATTRIDGRVMIDARKLDRALELATGE